LFPGRSAPASSTSNPAKTLRPDYSPAAAGLELVSAPRGKAILLLILFCSFLALNNQKAKWRWKQAATSLKSVLLSFVATPVRIGRAALLMSLRSTYQSLITSQPLTCHFSPFTFSLPRSPFDALTLVQGRLLTSLSDIVRPPPHDVGSQPRKRPLVRMLSGRLQSRRYIGSWYGRLHRRSRHR
jgi:hypothetical protein